jgi:hypothetical protein
LDAAQHVFHALLLDQHGGEELYRGGASRPLHDKHPPTFDDKEAVVEHAVAEEELSVAEDAPPGPDHAPPVLYPDEIVVRRVLKRPVCMEEYEELYRRYMEDYNAN